jgi:hypothetical protein
MPSSSVPPPTFIYVEDEADVEDLQWQITSLTQQVTGLSAEGTRLRAETVQLMRERNAAIFEGHRLRLDLDTARARIQALEHRTPPSAAAQPAPPPLAAVALALTRLIAQVHPDKWDNHPCATAVTRELLTLRAACAPKPR